MEIKRLKDLNELNKGIHKKWIYKDKKSMMFAFDYLQKIKFSIQDLNKDLSELIIDNKSVVFIISCIDWIDSGLNNFKKTIKDGIINEYKFSNQTKYKLMNNYFKTVRSFIVAHPLETNRHKDLGFDGTYICTDIYSKENSLGVLLFNNKSEVCKSLTFYGLDDFDERCDIILKTYSKKFYDGNYSMYIGIKLENIIDYCQLCIDELYDIDRFLSKQKKKDFDKNIDKEKK